jgi:hypothetical protein
MNEVQSNELTALEAARLDELQAAFYPKALAGSLPAAKIVLAISDRRTRLLGLIAREKTPENAPDDYEQPALIDKLNTMAERMRERRLYLAANNRERELNLSAEAWGSRRE